MTVRTVTSEYLIAMKLVAGRVYKHDLTDIIGILMAEPSISMEKIKIAFKNLYPAAFLENLALYPWLESVMSKPIASGLYEEMQKSEESNAKILKEKYPTKKASGQ